MNCSGLLGLVDCLLNDILKLGGTILGDLPLVNGVVAQLAWHGIVSLSNQSNVVYISPDRALTPALQQCGTGDQCVLSMAVWLYGRWHWSGSGRQRNQ